MISSRIVSFVLFFLTFGGLAFAIPAPVEKRADPAAVQNVLDTLRGNINAPLSELSAIAAADSATDETVTPRIESIINSLDQAVAALDSLHFVTRDVIVDKRQSKNAVAAELASIVQDITGTVKSLTEPTHPAPPTTPPKDPKPPKDLPHLPDHIKLIDGALGKIVLSVELLLGGVIKLLSGLLSTLSVLLQGLSFTLLTLIFGFK